MPNFYIVDAKTGKNRGSVVIDPYDAPTNKYAGLGFGENWVNESPEMPDEDRELAEAAQEAHDNLVRSLIEAGGVVREARKLLTRSLEMIYILGYDSSFTNPAIDTLTTDIKKFLEETK